MGTSQSMFCGSCLLSVLATLASAMLVAGPSGAETFCVQTVQEFQDALDDAETNNQDDTILLVRGTYPSSSSPDGYFYYASNQPNSLAIEGDWGFSFGDCARLWSPSPGYTTIDGGGSVPGLHLQVLTDQPVTVSVKYITFENGYNSSASNIAGGLTVFTGGQVAVTVEGNSFVLNETEGFGGGLNVGAGRRLQVINNLFAFNTAGLAHGAAALTGNASGILDPGVEIYNNSVAFNLHSGLGDAGLRIGGTATVCYVDNNIFWGNEGADLDVGNPNCTLLNNDIEDLSGTPAWNQGAMNVAPGWKNALALQFQLVYESPLINRGLVRITNHSMPLYDLDGLPRFSSNSPVDIGACEVQFLFYDGFDTGTTGGWSITVW